MTALELHDRNPNPGLHRSTAVANIAYKRSWREMFPWNIRNPRRETDRKGRPVETATAVEIAIGGLRQLFLDDFHQLLEKASADDRSGFFTVTNRPGGNSSTFFTRREIHYDATKNAGLD